MTASTGRSVTIVLPLPAQALSPNGRPSRWEKSSAVSDARMASCYRVMEACRAHRNDIEPFAGKARVSIQTLRCPNDALGNNGRTAPVDADNCVAACKAYFDGVRDSGLLAGDTAAHLEIGTVELVRCSHTRNAACPLGGKSGVTLTFCEVES